MSRLGLWGEGQPFADVDTFISFVNEHGVSAMEVVALDLKWQGLFLARQLSFSGASFEIREVDLCLNYINIYNKSVDLWVKIKNYITDRESLCDTSHKTLWSLYWGAHQRFFRYLCIAVKIRTCVQITKEAVRQGKSVVIGLQSTGEAQSNKQVFKLNEDEIDSTSYGTLCDIVSRLGNKSSCANDDYDDEDDDSAYRASGNSRKKLKTSNESISHRTDENACDTLRKLDNNWNEINDDLKKLKVHLPPNSLEQLIHDLGGHDKVAEMTGRKNHVTCNEYDTDCPSESEDENSLTWFKPKTSNKRKYTYEARAKETNQKTVNIDQKDLFLNNEKQIAIISDAASSGISLHASNTCYNKSKRVHITLELPWSADKAVQQFGRTHRSNQASAPEYIFLISKFAGENRFASSVAKRIESLNALTHGDRNATKSRDLSSFNIESKYGHQAIMKVVRSIKLKKPIEHIDIPEYDGDFFEDAKNGLEGIDIGNTDSNSGYNVKTFLNRILGMPVNIQNSLFEYFDSTLEFEIKLAKMEKRYDDGINVLDLSKRDIINETTDTYMLNDGRKVDLHSLNVQSGMSWNEALDLYKSNETDLSGNGNGFYFEWGSQTPTLAIRASNGQMKYMLFSPDDRKLSYRLFFHELTRNYRKVSTISSCEIAWTKCYKTSRALYTNILSGSIIGLFSKMKQIIGGKKLEIHRVNTGDKRIIGINVPGHKLKEVRNELKALK
jgi:hypothetical protein